jgi:hypothetical protein
MTSDRPYRAARPPHEAVDEIRRERGRQFDPEVVDAFLELEPRGLVVEPSMRRLPADPPTGDLFGTGRWREAMPREIRGDRQPDPVDVPSRS